MNFLRTLQKRCKTTQFENEDISLLLVLCMNCQEYIKSDIINKHALVCVTATKFTTNDIDSMDENNFKFQKIKLKLMEKQNNVIALRLSRIIELILQIKTVGKVEISCCQNYLNELNQLKGLPNSSLNLSLCIERIIVLIEERKQILKDKLNIEVQKNQQIYLSSTKESQTKHREHSIQDQNVEVVSSNFSKRCVNQTSQQKIDLEQFQKSIPYQNQKLTKSQSTRQLNIQNNQSVLPRPTFKKQFPHQSVQQQNIKSEILTNLSSNDFEAVEELDVQENSLQQRLFFSKLLKYKLQVPKDSMIQKISAKILWDEARKLRINQDRFDAFLQQAIKNPLRYLPNNF